MFDFGERTRSSFSCSFSSSSFHQTTPTSSRKKKGMRQYLWDYKNDERRVQNNLNEQFSNGLAALQQECSVKRGQTHACHTCAICLISAFYFGTIFLKKAVGRLVTFDD